MTARGFGDYDFTEKDIQLIKFINEIDSAGPIKRENTAPKNITLDGFKDVAVKVEEAINDNKYPAITDYLKSTLRTPEFLSLFYLHNLVKKVTQLFQYVCQSKYAGYNIYKEVMGYLDTLLYTYVANENLNEMMLNEYKKVSDKCLRFAHECDGKLEFKTISVYKGVNLYIEKIFNFITNEEQDSLSIEIQNDQTYKYDYRYEFKDIESLKEFLKSYYLYGQSSKEFYEKFSIINNEIYSEIANCVDSILLGEIDFMDSSQEQKENNLLILTPIINSIYNKIANILPESKRTKSILSKNCKSIIDMQQDFQNKLWGKYGNGDLLRLYSSLGYINAILELMGDNLARNIFEATFYDMIILCYF